MPREVDAPRGGFWRVARGPDPLRISEPLSRAELADPRAGNRFDSPLGDYSVLYFCSTLEGCFGETLARLRPDPELIELVREEWAERRFMPVGTVPAVWRHRRVAVRAGVLEELPFLDVEAAETVQELRTELAEVLAHLGYRDLDLGLVRGPDRRVTRAISRWAWEQEAGGRARYAGVRYLSRLNDRWECWAVFDDAGLEELERRPVGPRIDGLQEAANLLGLRVF